MRRNHQRRMRRSSQWNKGIKRKYNSTLRFRGERRRELLVRQLAYVNMLVGQVKCSWGSAWPLDLARQGLVKCCFTVLLGSFSLLFKCEPSSMSTPHLPSCQYSAINSDNPFIISTLLYFFLFYHTQPLPILQHSSGPCYFSTGFLSTAPGCLLV